VKSPAAKRASAVGSEFERRAARADALARESAAGAEPLRFAAGLYRAQGRLAAELDAFDAEDPLTGHADRDADRIRERAEPVLRFAAESGPERLSGEARARLRDSAATARTRLLVYWSGDRGAGEDYLSRAILRPYVELLRALNRPPDRIHRNGRCPFCGGGPWVAARREGSLMEGARRQLACSLCGVEWPFGRILCPSCLEQDPVKLPSFASQTHPTVRIEACETCRRYVKSLDLSEDARPIPEVDDLASLALDLWAGERGFTRVEPGLAGI
jgi:formate dehydrogenase maturation protein FdhE